MQLIRSTASLCQSTYEMLRSTWALLNGQRTAFCRQASNEFVQGSEMRDILDTSFELSSAIAVGLLSPSLLESSSSHLLAVAAFFTSRIRVRSNSRTQGYSYGVRCMWVEDEINEPLRAVRHGRNLLRILEAYSGPSRLCTTLMASRVTPDFR